MGMGRSVLCGHMRVRWLPAFVVGVLVFGAGCATLGSSQKQARLAGTLWWVTPADAERSIESWRRELDLIQELGMNLMVLNGHVVGSSAEPDPLLPFFEEADRRGIRLFLDTLAAPQWWTLEDVAPEIARAGERVRLLDERYGRFDSFYGYYIPYELYMSWDTGAVRIKALYREVAAHCKAVAPGKPVMISPFFILDDQHILGTFRWATPDEYEAFWTDVLGQAEIDVVALQDSGEHLALYTLEQRRPFFEAMKRACDATGTTLWGNVETGELNVGSMEEYVARFGLKTHVNDPRTRPFWRGVPPDKVAAKLAFLRAFSPTAITWGYREFIRPDLGPHAAELYTGYRDVLTGR